MIKVALKGLLGRKLRAGLTATAIVLGVAMVSGTYVLTDTIKAAFTTVFTNVYAKTDAVISAKSAIGTSNTSNIIPPSFPESLLAKVRALPGVLDAEGGIDDQAQLVGRNGKVLSLGGAPGLAFSVHPHGDQRFNPLELVSGGWPVGPGQVDIDDHTACAKHYKVGDTIGVDRARAGTDVQDRRHREDRRRLVARRRRRWRSSTSRPRRRCSPSPGSSTAISVAAKKGVDAGCSSCSRSGRYCRPPPRCARRRRR